ncbi:MAG: outer membrane protein assembly factor BamC [Pseudomonadales bacterium]|jgi:outer membrane protein assembly factor BamC|nr:outer membrane protein assembly factor BamC [Pseudomonadales bacterium]MCP5320752.1 outer membrane protein assembly factor BamC [Pseudomonadales bacterium]MCP5337551.1 outer membrane protein assembly factor BamC [Pseudomonadales bacterium]
MRPLTGLLLSLLTVVLAGCGWLGVGGEEGYFRDRANDYRKARSIPPMKAPEGTRTDAVSPLYAIPTESADALLDQDFEVPRPQPLRGDAGEKVVRIQKLGNEQWILLDETPAEAWPKIRSFLVSNQIGIEHEDASKGQMETSWLSFRSDSDRREKYRFRVEQGVQRASSEIYVLQTGYRQDKAQDAPPAEWPAASADPERETWMLKELANYLASTGDESTVSLLAQGISTVNKVYLVRDASGQPVIDLRLGFDRAWASLGRSLEHAELVVKDLDRSAGLYYVVYEPGHKQDEKSTTGPGAEETPKPKKGFFSRLWPWGSDDEANPLVGRHYRVEMRTADKGVLIGVRRDDGSAFEEGEAEFVLGLIKAHLS